MTQEKKKIKSDRTKNKTSLIPQKEGFYGWLSYPVFFIVSITVPILFSIDYINRAFFDNIVIYFPFYYGAPFIFSILIGCLLTLIIMKKSPYQFPKSIKNFYSFFIVNLL